MEHNYPEAYVEYLVYFHGERDYFECHEVLEEYWKEHPDSELREAWVGLIQVAVGLYHERRGNFVGARKMLSSAVNKLSNDDLKILGIDAEKFKDKLRVRVRELEQLNELSSRVYEDLNIPLTDESLRAICIAKCETAGVSWGHPSDLSKEVLIHKHKLRDRSDVVQARLAELTLRQQQRANR